MIRLNGIMLQFGCFPNGETRVPGKQITDAAPFWQSRPPYIHFRYETDADLLALLFTKRHLDSLDVRHVHLFIEYMPYSRMDRSEGGSVFTLRHVASFINGLHFDKVSVLEPHSDVTVALLDRAEAVPVTTTLVNGVMERPDFDPARDFIVYPDAGAQKRYARNGRKELVCYKHRDFQTGRIERLDLVGTVDKPGFTAIIADDLCSYGGTFVMTAQRLRDAGAAKVFLCVAHCENSIFKGGLFTRDEQGNVTGSSGLIDGVFTTNSILSEPDPTGLIHVHDTDLLWPKH